MRPTGKQFGAGIDQAVPAAPTAFAGLSILGADHELDTRAMPPEAAQKPSCRSCTARSRT